MVLVVPWSCLYPPTTLCVVLVHETTLVKESTQMNSFLKNQKKKNKKFMCCILPLKGILPVNPIFVSTYPNFSYSIFNILVFCIFIIKTKIFYASKSVMAIHILQQNFNWKFKIKSNFINKRQANSKTKAYNLRFCMMY